MELQRIGVVHSPYKSLQQIPRQGFFSEEEAVIEIDGAYASALEHVEESEWLTVLYWAHLAERDRLVTTPPSGVRSCGVFACRSPHRPNPLSLCAVKLLRREGRRLFVRHLDALDGSAVVDIKPYVDAVALARAEDEAGRLP